MLATQFETRTELVSYIRQIFPIALNYGSQVSPIRGGRSVAEILLEQIRPAEYAATRNQLDGAVTHLSPYLHHGVLSLAEVRRYVLAHIDAQTSRKILQELAWRDYYQRVYGCLADNIWSDLEPYKTGIVEYAQDLPLDILEGHTGLRCMDDFIADLYTNGYLHNHARMWLASYVVHHRRVRWQAGAHWFLQHLLDGDVASNNLSWQWVASTFAAKPYFFNHENLAQFTDSFYCRVCPLNESGCPFDGSYEDLASRLFVDDSRAQNVPLSDGLLDLLKDQPVYSPPANDPAVTTLPVNFVWLHEESLSPRSSALLAYPQAQPVFIFDEEAIRQAQWTLKRLVFIYECLLEIPGIQIYRGSPPEILTQLLEEHDRQQDTRGTIAQIVTNNVRINQQRQTLNQQQIPVLLVEEEPFLPPVQIHDLRRFSRYWQQVSGLVAYQA